MEAEDEEVELHEEAEDLEEEAEDQEDHPMVPLSWTDRTTDPPTLLTITDDLITKN